MLKQEVILGLHGSYLCCCGPMPPPPPWLPQFIVYDHAIGGFLTLASQANMAPSSIFEISK
jgi:hypothetical protein